MAGLGLLAGCGMLPPAAAPAARMRRVGYLSNRPGFTLSSNEEALRQGLRELGYAEGKDIVVEWRSGDGERGPERRHAIVADFVNLGVDVIVATGEGDAFVAREVTTTVPIVMVDGSDPVGSGLVASLARPGGNVTGLTTLRSALTGKRLELLKEVVPGLSRVAVLESSTAVVSAQMRSEAELAARAAGVEARFLDVLSAEDLETAFRTAASERADAALVQLPGPILTSLRTQIAQLALKSRLPTIHQRREDVEAGALMSYGVRFTDLYRRAATYVDKILKGARPADLPIEQPTAFELVVNFKTAQALGLTIPQSVLQQVTEVIQ